MRMLLATLCLATVALGQEWTPPTYLPEVYGSFSAKTHLNAPATPALSWRPYEDPYVSSNTTIPENWVCAIHYPTPGDRFSYETKQYTSREEAEAAGDFVTHKGLCGLCSSLNDLAVFMRKPDLTSEGTACALKVMRSRSTECYENIGFSSPCARIWSENAFNTKANCLGVCLRTSIAGTPNNDPPDSYNLNPCIQCDEDESGPVYKAYAGRSRRNSGLLSAINRPPESIYQVEHFYY